MEGMPGSRHSGRRGCDPHWRQRTNAAVMLQHIGITKKGAIDLRVLLGDRHVRHRDDHPSQTMLDRVMGRDTRRQPRPGGLVIDAPALGVDNPSTCGLRPEQALLPAASALAHVVDQTEIRRQTTSAEHLCEITRQDCRIPQMITKGMPVTGVIHAVRPEFRHHSPIQAANEESSRDDRAEPRQNPKAE
jgi:hypothetical protein